MANLSNLHPPAGQKQKTQRVGHGMGSGRGKYSGRGAKGQKSVSGYSSMRGFEGGQMPMQRRLPKRGFKNIFAARTFAVNLRDLEERFEAGTVTIKELHGVGLVPRRCGWVKVLGSGELSKKFVVKANAFSASAKDKIEKKGGRAEVVQG